MATIRDLNAMDLLKGTVAVVVSVIATLAWADTHFVTKEKADQLAKGMATKEKVDKLERIIVFQQLNMVDNEIEKEKTKPKIDSEKLHILYMQKEELKKQLGVK